MPKILIAEDDRTMVDLLKTLLKMEGYDVVAIDVRSNISAAVSKEKPDALLMDVHLGNQSGLEIVETIRANQENASVNIVMTSGLNVKEECIMRGANHFIMKPFMPDDLLALLKTQ